MRHTPKSVKHGTAAGPGGLVDEMLISAGEKQFSMFYKTFQQNLSRTGIPARVDKGNFRTYQHTKKRRHRYALQLSGNFTVKCH